MPFGRRLLRFIAYLGTIHRYAIGLAVAVVASLAAWGIGAKGASFIAGWDGFALTLIVIAWARIVTASPAVVVRIANVQHVNRVLLLCMLLGGACYSLAAVTVLLHARGSHRLPWSVALAVGTVICSWTLVHTVFTLHYAYLYYRRPGSRRVCTVPTGLSFPGHGQPDYFDFAYFSFVIGMTSQVSDVAIASREIRRWALLHGVISFGFNAAILAVSVNVISGMLAPG